MAIISALPETTTHLRRLESGLVIPATTGIRTFVTQRDMFPGFFDENFVEYGTDVPVGATTPASSDLYEMTRNGNFLDFLSSFYIDIEPLFWRSQDQILAWVETHLLHPHPRDLATFFPLSVGKKRFVAYVNWDHGMLEAYIGHLDCDYVRCLEYRDLVVLPQLGV